MNNSLTRFIGVFIVGVLTLSMILGSFGLAKLDPALVFTRPTRIAQIPTATLYPTVGPPTPTPLPTTTPLPTPTPKSPLVEQCTPPAGWVMHTVASGETFLQLAIKAGTSVYYLMQANCLSTPKVQPGSIIYLPAVATISPTAAAYTCGPPLHWRLTAVRPGDTLYSLAVRYGVTIDAIRNANCMDTVNIYVGQRLYLPPVMVITPTWTPYPIITPPPPLSPTPTWPWASPTPTLSPTPTWSSVTPTEEVTVTPTPSVTATAETPTPTDTPDITLPPPTPTETPMPTATATVAEPTVAPSATPTTALSSPTPTVAVSTIAPTTAAPTDAPGPADSEGPPAMHPPMGHAH